MATRTDRCTFEGRRTTRRTAAMVVEARRLFKAETGQPGPRASQGGYNAGGVSQSAGTHDRDAFDFATAAMSARHARIWEQCLGRVGFAAWWRRFLRKVWPQHHHAIPKGGDLSGGAQAQERSYRDCRDGMKGNRIYAAIRAYRTVTWESYSKKGAAKSAVKKGYVNVGGKIQKELESLSVRDLNRAILTGGKNYRETHLVQGWLEGLKLYKGPIDGTSGVVTKAALNKFRDTRHTPDRRGPMSLATVQRLRDAAKGHRLPNSNIHVYR